MSPPPRTDDRPDAVIIGFHEPDLDRLMEVRRRMADSSGAFRQMAGSVFRVKGHWLHHSELLNAAASEAVGRHPNLSPMTLPSLAACYLFSYLARRAFRVELVNSFDRDRERLEEILRQRPRAAVVTTTFYLEPEPIQDVIRHLKAHSPDTLVIVGGPFIHALCSSGPAEAQDRVLQSIGADIYIHSAQGEATLARVIRELAAGALPSAGSSAWLQIPNLVLPPAARGRDAFIRTPLAVEDNDMDSDVVDWDGIPARVVAPTALLFSTRSCPFRCSFCRYPSLAGSVRMTSIPVIEHQMSRLHAKGVRTLIFPDDTPNVPRNRFKDLLRMMIRRGFGFSWFSNLRCAEADVETYDLLAAAGCRGVFLGIESASQTLLDNMNKHSTVEAYRRGIHELRRRGILSYASFIVGFPGETDDTVRETIAFVNEVQPDYYQVHLYYHSRLAPIHAHAREFGLRGGDYSWTHRTMDWRRAADWVDAFREDIRGPVLGTSYLSTLWFIAYLHGLGAPLPIVRKFMAASADMIRRQRALWTGGHLSEEIPPAVVSAAGQLVSAITEAQR